MKEKIIMNVRFVYKLTRAEIMRQFLDGVFQWFLKLNGKDYTLYCNNGKYVLHNYKPPHLRVHVTLRFEDMLDYIFSKGEPEFFES